MTTTIEPVWGSETSLYGPTAISSGSGATTDAATNALCTEVKCKMVYGGTVNNGVKVYLLRCYDEDTPSYEVAANHNFVGEADGSAGGTHYFVFSVPADVSKFKIYLLNESGASVTCTIQYKSMTHYEVVIV